MTKRITFQQAWEEFKGVSYPDYPRTEELQNWNSRLLTIDGYIAGYATRIAKGSIAATEIPQVSDLINEVGRLSRELDVIGSRREEERLVGQYRSYIAALYRLVSEIGALATQERQRRVSGWNHAPGLPQNGA